MCCIPKPPEHPTSRFSKPLKIAKPLKIRKSHFLLFFTPFWDFKPHFWTFQSISDFLKMRKIYFYLYFVLYLHKTTRNPTNSDEMRKYYYLYRSGYHAISMCSMPPPLCSSPWSRAKMVADKEGNTERGREREHNDIL